MKCLYRYEDIEYTSINDKLDHSLLNMNLKIELHKYPIVKKTPKGVWINYGIGRRFVLLGAIKKFAYLTKKDAFESFKFRKQQQMKILTHQLCRVKEILYMIEYKK